MKVEDLELGFQVRILLSLLAVGQLCSAFYSHPQLEFLEIHLPFIAALFSNEFRYRRCLSHRSVLDEIRCRHAIMLCGTMYKSCCVFNRWNYVVIIWKQETDPRHFSARNLDTTGGFASRYARRCPRHVFSCFELFEAEVFQMNWKSILIFQKAGALVQFQDETLDFNQFWRRFRWIRCQIVVKLSQLAAWQKSTPSRCWASAPFSFPQLEPGYEKHNIWTAQGGGGSFQPQWTYRKKIWNSIGSKVNGLHIQLFCFELTNWLTN